MKNTSVMSLLCSAALTLFLSPIAEAATINVDCSIMGQTIQTAVNSAAAGDVIAVTGTCNENVLIRNEKQRLTLDGNNKAATINGSSASPTVNIRGKGILIQGFTITGGLNGIQVNRGANAIINNNTVETATSSGILIDQLSFAVIKNSLIQNNGLHGISVQENSVARIGFDSSSDTQASPNTIQNNTGRGISAAGVSSVRIVGNTITGNGDDGIGVFRKSQADLAANTINGNGTSFTQGSSCCSGVHVSQKSAVLLGEDNPVNFFGAPNTTTINNLNFGIRCTLGGVVQGHLGINDEINGEVSQFGGGTMFDTFSDTCPDFLVTP